ncbi:MAG TPA: hypothetical protein VEK08_18165 [Planctomycetota bacterium]|nr:hypothetical protein [Planctomycetota bacterium]
MAEITIAPDETAVGSKDPNDDLKKLSEAILHDMLQYAHQHNVDIIGARASTEQRQPLPKITITIPKYISQEHRDELERIAYTRAAQHSGPQEVQFIYEQSAG